MKNDGERRGDSLTGGCEMGCELTSAVRDSNGAGEPLIFCAGSAPAGYSHLSYMPATQPHEDSGIRTQLRPEHCWVRELPPHAETRMETIYRDKNGPSSSPSFIFALMALASISSAPGLSPCRPWFYNSLRRHHPWPSFVTDTTCEFLDRYTHAKQDLATTSMR